MIAFPFSVTLLGVITVLIFFGLGERVLDRMRLTDAAAIVILLLMIIGHFLPTISLSERLKVNLGGLIPLGIVIYLLATTSRAEQNRALLISITTALLVWLSDTLLPLQPGLLDPVFSAGIFAGLVATVWGRSRRGAFIAGILGILFVDFANMIQLWGHGLDQPIIIGGGGLFSSMVISPFLAVAITELIGEIREKLQLGVDHDE